MFPHALSSGVPAVALDMTTDFTPLFVGMVVLLSFCVIAFAFAIGGALDHFDARFHGGTADRIFQSEIIGEIASEARLELGML